MRFGEHVGSSADTLNELENVQNKSSSSSELNGDMDIGIVREFSFTSSLQRMSVITRKLMDKHFNVYCKGSPEMILTLCKPVSTAFQMNSTQCVNKRFCN